MAGKNNSKVGWLNSVRSVIAFFIVYSICIKFVMGDVPVTYMVDFGKMVVMFYFLKRALEGGNGK